ncbi:MULTISPECIES: sulfite exporter TauE/SafE family protein [Rhodococcus]|uniref:sulfite exporter TauE/SafE family protein n=1 Tax=Rhodococcus TaxID=1827 RepID=UPI0006BB4C22|nr:sulfite exporter TauE/SafE family protein [Rhodococcus opacus]NHU45512.1 sulfite exporter TauE/SafE family protein [Rhodococcus sp. A14]QZS54525.1 sulfite exporter TauE/SafE family protein [Rhodococcus opacus]UZG57247.1 sulfite exporter TauE/SafE family protein [Rhodococcus opacus]
MIDSALLLGAAVAAAVMVGAVLQRLSGTGLALVSAPLLTLLLGPATGVLLVNLCSICSAALIFGVVRRDVDWRRYRMLTAAATLGVLPGAVLVAAVPASWLALVVGVSVLVGLTATVLTRRRLRHHDDRRTPVVAAGFVSGLMNTTAGVAAPPMTIYALATRWPQHAFAATLQPFFLTVAGLSLITKLASGGGVHIDSRLGLTAAAALLVGVTIGSILTGRVNPAQARGQSPRSEHLGP